MYEWSVLLWYLIEIPAAVYFMAKFVLSLIQHKVSRQDWHPLKIPFSIFHIIYNQLPFPIYLQGTFIHQFITISTTNICFSLKSSMK